MITECHLSTRDIMEIAVIDVFALPITTLQKDALNKISKTLKKYLIHIEEKELMAAMCDVSPIASCPGAHKSTNIIPFRKKRATKTYHRL